MLYESSYYGIMPLGDYIVHHGIKGQKWGVRRFQNKDGTRTPAGKARYGSGKKQSKLSKAIEKRKKWKQWVKENEARKKAVSEAHDIVEKTYKIEDYASKLSGAYEKYQSAVDDLRKHREDFMSKAGTKEFKKYFERGLKNYVSNDADGEELKELCRQELRDRIKEGQRVDHSAGVDFAYYEYQKDDEANYNKLNSKWWAAREKYNHDADAYAKETYRKHGNAAMKAWTEADGGNYKEEKHNDERMIAYLIKKKTEERLRKE